MPSHPLAIHAEHVTKIYRRFAHKRQFATLKSAILSGSLVRDLKPDETFRALDDVSFDVEAGRTYGIIGRNGSGKSTMLKCVAGIAKPTTGKITVNGRISALIELGAGFHPEISGRENVFINGIMLGLSKAEIERRFDEIVEFAELAPFIDAPVKTYSSGMYMRLGFAVAVHVDPDILLVDEVLAVGDEGFAHKCLDKFAEFRRRGKTILLVTHSLGLVERFCDEALWLDKGKVKAVGDPKRVIDAYVTEVEESEEAFLAAEDARARVRVDLGAGSSVPAHESVDQKDGVTAGNVEAPADMFKAEAGRWGSGDIEITRVELVGPDGDGRARVPHWRGDDDPVAPDGPDAGEGLRLRHRPVQRRWRLHLRHEHQHRGDVGAGDLRRRTGGLRDRGTGAHRRYLQARSRGAQARRFPVRLPSPALHLPRQVADQGRRVLPSAPLVDASAPACVSRSCGDPRAGART